VLQDVHKLQILALNTSAEENALHYFISSPSEKNFNIEIINSEGKMILSKAVTENNGTLDFSEFARGVYLLRVFDNANSAVRKFIY
jgi:hypothetical protein